MKIKEQTRKLAAGCSKHSFEVVDKTDEVSEHIYGKVKLTWFEEIFEEYKLYFYNLNLIFAEQNQVFFYVFNRQRSLPDSFDLF